jgi:hypothetical protein
LQDQSVDLEKWLNIGDDPKDTTGQMVLDEQRTARQSVIEGQAMVVLYDYQLMATGQTVETDPSIVDLMRGQMLSEDSGEEFAKAPISLREAMLFPYSYGTDFAVKVLLKRGKQAAFAGVLQHPPLDTHQLMEPAAYLNGEPQVQVQVAPLEKVLGPGWRRDDFDGFGEIDLRVICLQWGGKAQAEKLAPTWRGGYYMTLLPKKPPKNSDAPLAMVMDFATEEAARQFGAMYIIELPRRYDAVQATESAQEWKTSEGTVRLYVEGKRVIALESFSATDAAKLHTALAAAKPAPIAPVAAPLAEPAATQPASEEKPAAAATP